MICLDIAASAAVPTDLLSKALEDYGLVGFTLVGTLMALILLISKFGTRSVDKEVKASQKKEDMTELIKEMKGALEQMRREHERSSDRDDKILSVLNSVSLKADHSSEDSRHDHDDIKTQLREILMEIMRK